MQFKLYLASFLLLLAACGNDTVESLQNIQNSEFNELVEMTEQDQYEPPADGLLTDDHIKMYIAVKAHEKSLLKNEAEKVKEKVAKVEQSDEESLSGIIKNLDAIQQAASYSLLDVRAAKALGYNSAEYEWVKETLLEASSLTMMGGAKEMQAIMINSIKQSIPQLEKARDESSDPQMRTALDEQIMETKKNLEEMKEDIASEQEQMTAAMKHNIALYAKHKDALNVLENEFSKWQHLEELTRDPTQAPGNNIH